MKKYLSLFAVLIITFILGTEAIKAQDETKNESGLACTMEARQCSDGSFVGRSGPNCEFAKCPDGEKLETEGLLPSPKTREVVDTKREEIKREIEAEKEKIKKEIRLKREELKAKMDVLKENIKDEKNTTKAKIKEERIYAREKALEKFDKMVENITGIKDKIEMHLTYFDTKKVDTTGARVFLDTIKTKLNDTEMKIATAHELLSNSVEELTKEEKTTLQDLTKDIQNIVNEIRDALNNTIKSLKDSVVNKK